MSHLVCLPEKWRTSLITTSEWPDHLIAAGLALAFSAIVLGVPQTLPLQAASWLTFIGVVITPGYFLGELLVGRAPLDRWERLSLAFPLGMAAIAPAGMASLLLHLTIRELAVGWSMTVGVILMVWLLTTRWMCRPAPRPKFSPWQWDELAMLLLLIAAFVYMFPTLSLYKMDGDAYAVATFTSDALTGRPMNATEPVLGTGQNVSGLRMGFNQLLAVFHLWSYLSGAHHIELLGNASRSMLALWALLASYTLGKAAGNGSRRFGLLAVSFQTLIYLAAPFMRTDSVSIFFFERINADKFTVTVTMLPVVIAFAIRYVREGRRDYWITAAVGAFAVSSIHALIAAMLALALGAFGGVHLLLNLRRRVAWRRVIGLALVVAVTMGLPLIQLVIAQGSDALAPTYPSTFEGWSVGKRLVPVLPFVLTPNVDYYGPLPNLAYLTPDAANETTNPFLIWRFALNMRRQRLILFDIDHYISDPTTILEPPYLLALLLLPVLLFRLRSDLGAQYAVGTSLAVLLVMFNPILTPILGGLVMPWILWRFVWLLPYALIFALVATPLLNAVVGFLARLRSLAPHRDELRERAPLALVILCTLCLWPNTAANIQSIQARGAGPFVYGTPSRLLARLQEEVSEGPPVMVMSDQNLSVTIPSFVGNADIVAHRILSTAEMMGAEDQDVALERHLDQYHFLYTPLLTATHLDILKKYDIRYIVLPNGTNLDAQLRLSPQWFEWLIDDQGYSLYAVRDLPEPTASMAGNLAMLDYRWDEALAAYGAALEQDPSDMLALLGTASIHAISGQFDLALAALREALALSDSPVLHYRLGQVYGDMGEVESSIVEFYEALRGAPSVPQFHMALADACLNAGQVACAQSEFEAALTAGGLTDEVQQHTRLAAIWQQRGRDDLALAHYEQAAEIRPNESTQLLLASAHQRRGDYDRAEQVLATLRKDHPLSATVLAASARLLADQGDVDGAIALYQRAIRLQAVLAQDTRTTRLEMAQTLFDQNRLGESRDAVEKVLRLDPQNTSAYLLLGNLYRQETQPAMAMEAYRKALQLDPTDAAAYVSLNDQFRQQAIPPEETLALMETAAEVSSQQSLFSLSLADQFRRLGDVDMSIATYKLVLGLLDAESSAETLESNKRNRAVAFSRLGALHEDIGELDVALSYYRAAVAVAPTQTWAQVALGDALRRRNQVDAAEAAYRAVIERESSNVEAHLRLADLLGARGDPAAASELYRQAIETALAESDPTRRSRALQSLSSLYIQYYVIESPIGSDYEPLTDLATEDPISQQALEAYAQALELESSVAGVSLLARLSLEQGDAERAIELYQQSIQLAEQEGGGPLLLAQYHVGLGDAYLAIGRANAALGAYRTAVELDGWWPAARLALARAWTDLGDQESALAELQAAAQIAPGSVETQLALAELLDERGDHEKALEIYEATVQAHSGNMAANLGLARALQRQNLWPEAESRYRQAMTMVANDLEPYVGLADLSILQGRFKEAEVLLRAAIGLDRRDPTAYLRLGELLASRLRFTEAFDVYRQALQASPGDWQPYAGLANVYQALGDIESAEKSLQQAATVDATAIAPLLQLAGLYLDQNQPDQAEEVFMLALERSPGDAAIRQALAEFYQSMGLGEEALLQLRLAAEENPHSTTVLIAYANQLRLLGREEEANDLYRQAEENPEPSAVGYRALALTYETRGEWEEALAWLDRALELAPNEATNWIQKGELEVQMGRVEEGLASLERATQLGPGQGQTWYALGNTLLTIGQIDEATNALEQAIAVEPTYLPAYGALVDLECSMGHYDQASQMVAAAQSAAPGSYLVQIYAANQAEAQLDWDTAEAALTEAIAKAPGVLDPYIRLGELLARKTHYAEALNIYERGAAASPGDWQPYAGLANVYQALGDIESAEKSLQQAAAADATAVAPLLQLAGLYLDQNQPDQAEEVFMLALQRSPGDATIRQALAEFYQSMGLGEEALLQLSLAAEENPHSTTVLIAYANQLRLLGREEEANDLYRQAEENPEPSAVGYRALALTYETRGEWEEALAWLDRALELAPNEAANWVQKGELEVQMGRVEEGLASLERATQLGPGQGQTWYALGNTLLSLGQIDKATSALEQAIAVEPTYLAAYGALVEIYQQLGQDERLVTLITQAKLAVPGSYLGYLYDAQYLQSQLQWEKARAALAQAIARALGDPGPYVATAQLEERLGNMAQAFAWYEQAASLRPGESLAVSQYIDLLFSRGENLEALAQTELALRTQPGNADLLLRLGRLQRALGQYPEAKASLEKGIRSDPSRADLWAEVALLHLAQGAPQEALAAYDRAIALEPGQESYYSAKSTIVRAQGQPKEAFALLENALTKVTDPTLLYAVLSELYLEQGNPQQALSILEQGREDLGDESNLLISLASYYESQARFDQAEESYRRGVSLHPDEAAPYLALARFLQSRGRLTEAEDAYEQALALEPSNAEVYRAFGDLHRLADRSDKAAEAYSLALAFDPRSEEGYIGQAALYGEQCRWDEARATFEKGLSVLPISERLLTQYSDLLLQRGDEDGALRLREQALNVSKSASAYLSRADLYRRMGRTNEARADLRSALEVEPGSVDALLTLGDLESQSRAALAEQYYRQAASLAPGTAMPHLRLADLAYRQGRLTDAWREFETAARVQPASAEAWGQRAEALREAGDWQAAEAAYRQAILRAPLSMETYVELATLAQNGSGGLPEALDWLQQASRLGADQGTVYLAFAELYRGAGQARQAEIYLERARLADPASSEAELALADFYLSQGRPEMAQRHAASALSLAPAEPATFILSARISHALGDLVAAENYYRQAIAVDATRMDGYLALAEFYRVQERTSQAIAIYEQIVDATPLDWSAWVSLGNLYAEMGNENDALLAYGKAIEVNASVPEPWFGQGDVYMDQGLASAALAAYRQAETLRPGQAAPLLRLAGFYEQEGDLDQAETYARRAIAADPSAAAYLTLGRILGTQEDPEAADAYLRSIQQDPRQTSVYNAWIALHTDILQRPYRLDRSRLAVALGELAGSDDSGALWALTLLGRGYYALEGATDRSIGYLEEAQRFDPTFADLYQNLAWAYEQRLDGPHALELWRRYLYAVTGRGNTAEAEAHVTMLLQIRIDKPAAGASVSGAVEIVGTAAPDGFQYYKLVYRRADGQGDWHGIGEPVYQQVRGGLLGTWSTGNLAPGKYWLRLIVVDTTGNEKPYDEVQVTVKGAG